MLLRRTRPYYRGQGTGNLIYRGGVLRTFGTAPTLADRSVRTGTTPHTTVRWKEEPLPNSGKNTRKRTFRLDGDGPSRGRKYISATFRLDENRPLAWNPIQDPVVGYDRTDRMDPRLSPKTLLALDRT
jgi:hypothetical protein